jgi:hypothetical protein
MREQQDLRKPKASLQLRTRGNKVIELHGDDDLPHIRKEKHIQMILNKNDPYDNNSSKI